MKAAIVVKGNTATITPQLMATGDLYRYQIGWAVYGCILREDGTVEFYTERWPLNMLRWAWARLRGRA